MKYTWLLFDADDTLFDFPAAEANALRWTLEQAGLPYHPEFTEVYHRCNQQAWKEFERGELSALELRTERFRRMFAELQLAADPEQVSPIYLRNLSLGSDLIEGAAEVIPVLRARYRLALVTNGLAEVQRPRLARSPLCDSFEQVFISEEMGVAKPAAAFFDRVFQALGSPERAAVLIIGDSLTSDMRGGVDYGVDTCWYNPAALSTDLPVTYQITRLVALLELLA